MSTPRRAADAAWDLAPARKRLRGSVSAPAPASATPSPASPASPPPPPPPPPPPSPPGAVAAVGLRDLPEAALQALFDLTAASTSDEPWSRKRALGFIFRSSAAPVPRPEYVAVVRPGRACFGREFGAHALAAAAPWLADVYRRTCVSTLVVHAGEVGDAARGPRGYRPLVEAAAMFARFPAADALVVNNDPDHAQIGMDGLAGCAPVPQCERLILRRVEFQVGDVDLVRRAFPALAELVLIKCTFSDTDIALISWRMGTTLRRLRILGAKLMTGAPRHVADAGAVGLGSMSRLEILCLDRQSNLTSRTFGRLAALTCLRSLNLDYTKFRDDDAKALHELSHLLNLSVSGCDQLTSRMLQYLPSNLETLNISQTAVVTNDSPVDALTGSPPVLSKRLVTLQADQMSFTSWRPLRDVPSLRQVYMRKCKVSAEGALETFVTWPELRRLDISGCESFGAGGGQEAVHHFFMRRNNPAGDAAVEALAYVARNVKEMRVDNINFCNAQWVAVATKVMSAPPGYARHMTLLTVTNPESEHMLGWGNNLLASNVSLLLMKAFPRAGIRYKPAVEPRHHV